MDFNSQNFPATIFWALKSIHLKVAKVKKHCTKSQGKELCCLNPTTENDFIYPGSPKQAFVPQANLANLGAGLSRVPEGQQEPPPPTWPILLPLGWARLAPWGASVLPASEGT